MARARRAIDTLVWPSGLDVCAPADWVEPGEDVADAVVRTYRCWSRWIGERYAFLRAIGVPAGDAMVDSVGDFPRWDWKKERRRG